MSEVEEYIYAFEGDQKAILLFMHTLLSDELNLRHKLRFKIPFYDQNSWICYLNPRKNKSVEFAFIRGNELSNEQGLLQSKGRKQVWSVEFSKVSEIPIQSLKEIIHEAILLDESVSYKSKRKKTIF